MYKGLALASLLHPAINYTIIMMLMQYLTSLLVVSICNVSRSLISRHLLSSWIKIFALTTVAVVLVVSQNHTIISVRELSCSIVSFALPTSLCAATSTTTSIDRTLVPLHESIPKLNELIWDESSRRMASENIQRLQVTAERLIPRASNIRFKESQVLDIILETISYAALDVLNELHRYEVKIAKHIH